MFRRAIAVAISAVLLGTGLSVIEQPQPAEAINAADFDPGYIISDELFYDGKAMTEAQIQSFLNARIGTCNNSNCLNIYKQTTQDRAPSERCLQGYKGAANESAARIIFKVQTSCNISAKVILVTLQKEQSLVTSKSPSLSTLERAMGYYCPDDPTRPGWCNPIYGGFFNQVLNAAAQFQRYRLHPASYGHRIGTQNVRYHPTTSCGSRSVNIRNAATAGLYNYTPYTPNQAAMNNLYGIGDSCSAYGNRNFWRIYSEWFGNPTGPAFASVSASRLSGSDRYATAVEISKFAYPDGAPTVYVAVGSSFPDGLAAAPAAARAGGPLLLVPSTSLPGVVKSEIQRLKPANIVVVGGSGVVPGAVVDQLRPLAGSIRRDAGADRYATAREIAKAGFSGGASVAFVASGADFPDALAASAAAGALGGPVILVPPGSRSMEQASRQLIADLGVSRVVLAGGSGVLPGALADSIRSISTVSKVERAGGATRYETAAALNALAFPTTSESFLASGTNFPDALAAAAAAGARGSALHLSPGACVPKASIAHLNGAGVTNLRLVGGPSIVANPGSPYKACP